MIKLYDDIGYVEQFDFSTANSSYEKRVEAVQMVASICYNSRLKEGSDRLFRTLGTESMGLPSSSYEFVPVLLSVTDVIKITDSLPTAATRVVVDKNITHTDNMYSSACERYGEWIKDRHDVSYLLTNLRALIADAGNASDLFYNSDEHHIELIREHFKVFKTKIPLFVARQFMRHRTIWQELSRRYVSGKKLPFEVYVSPKLSAIHNKIYGTSDNLIMGYHMAIREYNALIESGAKPEDARQILPQCIYTNIWSAWLPRDLKGMLELRTHNTAQDEIILLANAIQSMTKD